MTDSQHHRVYLARHDRTAGLRGGKLNLADAAARAAPKPADVIRNLEQTHRKWFLDDR